VTNYRQLQTTIRASDLASQEADAAERTAANLDLGAAAHHAYARYLRAVGQLAAAQSLAS